MRTIIFTLQAVSYVVIINTVLGDVAWDPNVSEGEYRNPVIFADYSDPDAIRVGDEFYMVASSIHAVPGLPLLHSKDLVNWEIVNHILPDIIPEDVSDKPRHGSAVWAPTIRYHEGEYYVYYGDPDYGIYMSKTKDPEGDWPPMTEVRAAKGWIDPCPFWDDDGNAYMALAFSASRNNIRTILAIAPMSSDGTELTGDPVIVFDGHDDHPTIEGPKLYKRDGYYYIFAPAGGVTPGWQTVLRSKNIYGPYELRTTLAQGSTDINGPHQGAWVELKSGEDWFLHFQDRKPYGRVVHLQPMKWEADGFPVMGTAVKDDVEGVGEPVKTWRKPDVGKTYPRKAPQTSDEFNAGEPGLQWQWQANEGDLWKMMFPAEGILRLYPVIHNKETFDNLWQAPNLFMQKFPAPSFTATTKLDFEPHRESERTGLVVFGHDYATLSVKMRGEGLYLSQTVCKNARKGNSEKEVDGVEIPRETVYLRVEVEEGALCQFSYSTDNENFTPIGEPFQAVGGTWVGAKVGLFCNGFERFIDCGYADYDWFRVGGGGAGAPL